MRGYLVCGISSPGIRSMRAGPAHVMFWSRCSAYRRDVDGCCLMLFGSTGQPLDRQYLNPQLEINIQYHTIYIPIHTICEHIFRSKQNITKYCLQDVQDWQRHSGFILSLRATYCLPPDMSRRMEWDVFHRVKLTVCCGNALPPKGIVVTSKYIDDKLIKTLHVQGMSKYVPIIIYTLWFF